MSSSRPDPELPIQLRPSGTGVFLPVHAQPGSRHNGINGVHNGRLKVSLTQVAEKGKANKELARLLSRALGISRSAIELRQGETSQLKEFHLTGVTLTELSTRLQTLLNGPDASRPRGA